tara:strand:- start:2810 stop:3841 length:1032 start_codon:yes stop_codon:yes gene_type:complete
MSLRKVFLCYDLEACFLRSGTTRKDTKILEIALYNDSMSYQRLVNPLTEYDNGTELINNLDRLKQHPENTVNFWTKLLIGKKALPTSLKRKTILEKADAISTLLKRSDVAREYNKNISKSMMQALARHKDDEDKAKNDLRDRDDSFNQLFYTPKEALEGAIEAANTDIWVGHNGKSFDEKILKGHDHDWDHITFVDSLYIIKQLKPGLVSYSQPLVFKHLFGGSYFAHHALEDAMALWKIMEEVLGEKCVHDIHLEVEKIRKEKKVKKRHDKEHRESNLYTVKGIGPATVKGLYKKDITTKEDLMKLINSIDFDTWCDQYSFVHHHKKFYELYKGTVVNSAVV